MNRIKYLALLCILCGPQIGFAAEGTEIQYTAKEKIVFSPESMIAFDHSGKLVTHSAHADGSESANHNGSMGNVTVARLGPNGTIETYCTSDALTAKAFMAGEIVTKRSTVASPVRRD
jgi:hypothetical protein